MLKKNKVKKEPTLLSVYKGKRGEKNMVSLHQSKEPYVI